MVADMGNEWECRTKINSCRQCRNIRDEFNVIVISNRRNKIIFELFVKRSIYRILTKFIELLGYLSPIRTNVESIFLFTKTKCSSLSTKILSVEIYYMYITRCFGQDVLSKAYKALNLMHVEFKTPMIYQR